MHALFLDNNCVDDDAALHVAALLKTDSKIKHLRLDTNGVGDGGVQAIAEALVANAASVPAHPDLDANQFGQGGTRHLSVALQKCPHLTRIDADRRFARDDSGVSQPKSRRKLTRHSSIDAGRESMARLPSACVWQIWRFFLDFLPIFSFVYGVAAQRAVLAGLPVGSAATWFAKVLPQCLFARTDGDLCRCTSFPKALLRANSLVLEMRHASVK